MKKIIFSILFAFISIVPLSAQAGVPEAVNYLKSQTLDDWTAQALVAAGEIIDPSPLKSFTGSLATDYAKRIMALVAAGKNPTTYTGSDLVAGLKSFAQSGQLGDATLINDDAWGIMALRSAGLSANDPLIQTSAQFLIDNQNTDGGWSWGVGFDSDTNDTAAVLMALAEAGYTVSDSWVAKGVAYLASQQNNDAGWPYQLPCFWPNCEASDSASTAWIIAALNKLGLNAMTWTKAGVSPQNFLLTLQTGDGSFKWQAGDAAGSPAITAYALVALTNKSYPVARGNYLGGQGHRLTPLADLEINFAESGININKGELAGLTIKLINHGPNIAQAVVAKLVLPEGLTITEFRTSEGEFSLADKQWTFIRFNNYAEAQLNVIIKSDQALTDAIKITVSAQEFDLNLKNNEAFFDIVVKDWMPEVISKPMPEVLGETSYSCESVPIVNITGWLGQIISTAGSATPWYIDPVSQQPYCLADSGAAYRALEKFGLGITNDNLAKIPVGQGEINTVEPAEVDNNLVNRLRGRILLQVESLGEAWYVDPTDGQRYYLANGQQAWQRFFSWRVQLGQ